MTEGELKSSGVKWALALATLALMLGAAFLFRAEWFGPLNRVWGVGWLLGVMETSGVVAFFVTLGLCSLLEVGVRRALGLGHPVIGATVFGWLVALLLIVLFYTVFAATALFSRIMGMKQWPHCDPHATTYWRPHEPMPITFETMKRQ